MTFWAEMVIRCLAVVGVWVTVDKAAAGIVRAWGWLRRDRVTPLLEDEPWRGCACCGIYPAREWEITCEDCAGWEERALDHEAIDHRPDLPDLPPERSREELGFTTGYLRGYHVEIPLSLLDGEARERRAPWWEAEHRAAYESLGFDYPSGLMARIRELAP